MEVVITPDSVTLTNYKSSKETNTMPKLNPRPVYQQSARSNATNSELDAKVVITHNNKLPRLTNNEWDTIFSLIDNKYATIREKLLSYKNEDEVINRLCDTSQSDYERIPNRY